MPKLNGFQVLETLKQDPVLKLIRIIVLTTSNQEQDILKSYSHGVASYISKPIDSGDFFRVIFEMNEYWFRIVKLPPKER
jgi:CheY-like chemotaxis protein